MPVSLVRMQGDLLHAPVRQLTHVQFIGVAAVYLIDRTELLNELARFTELAHNPAVQFHLVDLAVVHRAGVVGIGRVEILVGPGGNANRPGRARIGELGLEFAVVVEDLNALVPEVAHVNVALGVGRERMRRIELAGLGTSRSPGLEEFAALVELGDARVAVTIGYKNVAGRIPTAVKTA